MDDAVSTPAPIVGPHRRAWTWLRAVIGAAILAWLIGSVDWNGMRSILPRVHAPLVFGCALLYALLQIASAFKWQLLLRAQGVRLPLGRLARFYFIGMFFSLSLPTIVGGDAVRAYLMWKESGQPAAAMSSILVERVTGFVAMLAIGLIGAATAPILPSRGAMRLLGLGILACAGLAAVLLALRMAHRTPLGSFPLQRQLGQVVEALVPYGRSGLLLLVVMGISFGFQYGMVALHLLLLRACGYTVPLAVMEFVVPVLTIASLLPISVNGLGVRETTSVYLLRQVALSAEIGLITALLWRFIVALASLPGLFFWLRYTGGESPTAVRQTLAALASRLAPDETRS